MERKKLKRLSFDEIQSILSKGKDDDNMRYYFNSNVAIARQLSPDVVGEMAEQPLLFPDPRVLICLEGEVHPHINLLDMDVRAGDLLYVGGGSVVELPHDMIASSVSHLNTVRGIGITMTSDVFHLALAQQVPPSLDGHLRHFKIHLEAKEIDFISRLVDLMYDSLQSSYNSHVFLNLVSTVFWFIDAVYQRQQEQSPVNLSREQKLFSNFIALVGQYARTQHNIGFYADRLFLSPRYMSTIVKAESGRSAKEWIDEALVTAIKIDLRYTQKPLKQIADEMEFPNMSFFSKFFRRLAGTTPMEYRKGTV